MILVISSLLQSPDTVSTLQQALNEPVKISTSLGQAIEELQSQAFPAVIFDQLLLNADGDASDAALKNLGNAVPVYMNFAIMGAGRIASELRFAVKRRSRELLAAKDEAERSLRHEFKEKLTAILLSCEMALLIPELPVAVTLKLQSVEALAREMSGRLEEPAV